MNDELSWTHKKQRQHHCNMFKNNSTCQCKSSDYIICFPSVRLIGVPIARIDWVNIFYKIVSMRVPRGKERERENEHVIVANTKQVIKKKRQLWQTLSRHYYLIASTRWDKMLYLYKYLETMLHNEMQFCFDLIFLIVSVCCFFVSYLF